MATESGAFPFMFLSFYWVFQSLWAPSCRKHLRYIVNLKGLLGNLISNVLTYNVMGIFVLKYFIGTYS